MSDEVGPPARNERGDEFIVQTGLSTSVGTEPIVDVGGTIGVLALRDDGEPPVSFPLEVTESPPHLFNSQQHLLLVSFGPCLTLRPVDAVKILTLCVRDRSIGGHCRQGNW